MTKKNRRSYLQRKSGQLWQWLGPGMVTGAADDDPSGIATYSQAGAQIGNPILWTMVFTWPLMSAIQMVSAQIGRVTGRGLAANMRKWYGRKVTLPLVLLLLISNVFNLGADIGAMGTSAQLALRWKRAYFCGVFYDYFDCASSLSSVPKIRKCVEMADFCFAGLYWCSIFRASSHAGEVLEGTFIPTMSWNKSYMSTFVALLGTTISPYLFFWQSSQEVEEIRTHKSNMLCWITQKKRRQYSDGFAAIRCSVWAFQISSPILSFLQRRRRLHAHGITEIETASQAAEALRPLAGPYCFLLFSLGIIGTGLLAVPVLAGSAAFAVGEALQFRYELRR